MRGMKVTIYKKASMLSPTAFAMLNLETKPPVGFRPCATVECSRIADILKEVKITPDEIIAHSPHIVATRIVNRLTMRSIPFKMAFLG